MVNINLKYEKENFCTFKKKSLWKITISSEKYDDQQKYRENNQL